MKHIPIAIFAFFSLLTLFVSFVFNYDISGGGSTSDFETHWKYIKILNSDLNNLFNIELGKDFKLLNFPLHHIIFSRLDFIVSTKEIYLLSFFIFSLFLPLIFYLNCKILYKDIPFNKLLNLSLIIFLLPNFQSSAIWGNNHITALFFFVIAIFFLNKLKLKINDSDKFNILLSLTFLTFASYTRQYYIIFFPFFLLEIYASRGFKNLIFIFFTLVFLSIPGFIFLVNNPKVITGYQMMDITDLKSSVIIVLSMISIYLIPFYLVNFKKNIEETVKILSNKNTLSILIILFLILIYFCSNFYYQGSIGGGVIHKLSFYVLGNNIILFAFSLIGLFLLFFYKNNTINYYMLIIPLLFSFSSGFFIFQKYFEPLMIFIFILFFNKEKIKQILNKNLIFINIYFIFYWSPYYFYSIGQLSI